MYFYSSLLEMFVIDTFEWKYLITREKIFGFYLGSS